MLVPLPDVSLGGNALISHHPPKEPYGGRRTRPNPTTNAARQGNGESWPGTWRDSAESWSRLVAVAFKTFADPRREGQAARQGVVLDQLQGRPGGPELALKSRAVQESESGPCAQQPRTHHLDPNRCHQGKTATSQTSPPTSPSRRVAPAYSPTHVPQRSVLFAASSHLRRVAPRRVKESTPRAAVILATPRHASWLTDEDFMSGLVTSLRPDRKEPADLHVLAAVVDGVASTWPSREMRDGFSIQLGSLHDILPGLWDEATNAPSNPESEPSCLSVLLPRDLTLTLPLANTLFQTGRRSTLLASVWGDGWPKIIEKRSQTVNLSRLAELRRSGVHVPLVPITHPRMILEGLGNILAKIDIEGEPSPASKELQVNIPRLLEARRLRPTSTQGPGPVGVWALVIPGSEIWGPGDRHLNASPETTREALLSFLTKISVLHHSSPAYGKLAYELSSEREGLAWEISPFLDHILQRGAHFHKICETPRAP